jgi:hypothetical protein
MIRTTTKTIPLTPLIGDKKSEISMLIKDLFNEIIRRLEWSKDRALEPTITGSHLGYQARIPVDDSLAYVVKIDEVAGRGSLLRSFFPDGEPHHCIALEGTSPEEVASLIHAASLIIYGKMIACKDEKKGS